MRYLIFSILLILGCKVSERVNPQNNTVGQPLTGDFYPACDTINNKNVFLQIINGNSCGCFEKVGSAIVEIPSENCVEGFCIQNDLECEPVSVNNLCFLQQGEQIKLAVQSSDCDSGAADAGEENCGVFRIDASSTITGLSGVASDPTVTISSTSLNGTQAEIKYCWIQDAAGNTPSGGYELTIETEDGNVVWVAEDSSPEAICNNDGRTQVIAALTEVEVKEFCYKGCPNTYEINGVEVDINELLECEEEEVIDEENYEIKYVCIIDESAVNGIIGERWDNSDGDDTNDVGATDFLPNSQVFTNGDHINGDPTSQTTITNNWSLNDLDFGAIVVPDIHSQERYCAYLNIREPMILRDNNGNWGEYLSVFIEDCNKDMVQVANTYTTRGYPNNSAAEFYTICEGIRKIEIQVNDFSWYGGFNLQFSTDGGTNWSAFPMSDTYTFRPKVNDVCIKIDEEGNQLNLDGSEFTGNLVKCDPACYPMSRESIPDTEVSIINGCFDVDGDPANYINVTQEVIFSGGEQTSVLFYQNYGADSQTEIELGEYTFVDCATGEPIDEPVVPVECESTYVVDAFAPQGTNGVNFEYWTISGYTAQDEAADVFNGAIDYSGMPAINSNEGLPQTRKEADLFIRDPLNGQNAYRYWTYLYTTKPIRVREYHPTAESAAYYLGECQSTPTLSATGEYLNNTLPPAFDVSLPAGIHYLGGEVYDFSVWGFTRFQYSDDGGVTWKNIPPSWLYCEEPILSECQVQVCTKESGLKVLTDIETCLPLGTEYTLKKPSLCSGELAVVPPVTCELVTFYKISFPTIGTVEQQWTTNAVNTSTASGVSYRESFSGTDAEGYPQHQTPTPDATVSSSISSTTNISGTGDDQAQSDFWIYLEEDTDLREFNGTAESAGVWISSCGTSNMSEVVDGLYTNSSANPIGIYQSGFYRVRLYHADISANGISRLQGLTNGTWSVLTPYLEKPTVEVVKEWVCNDQDINEFATENGYLCEDPRCFSQSSNVKIIE